MRTAFFFFLIPGWPVQSLWPGAPGERAEGKAH